MSNQPQRALDPDFLDGIDDQFQRLMKLSTGRRNGRANGRPTEDPLMTDIIGEVQALSPRQKELVLAYVRSIKPKAE
jgi:hypothetical protein